MTVAVLATTVDGPVPGSGTVDADGRLRLRDRLVDGVTTAVAGLPAGAVVDVGLPVLRRAVTHPDAVGSPDEPFVWKPAFARRSLGLAAVRACADGRFRGPAEAVGPLADGAVDEWRRTGWRTFHWEPWFAGLGAGARAVVLAEATTWATPLWVSADWATLGDRARIGGPDDVWTCPGPRTVRLKGRCEARVAPARVSLSCGVPGPTWAEELGYLALVAALACPDEPVPARVVGMWPEAGARRSLEVDEALLGAVADRVVEVVGRIARAHGATAAGHAVPD